MYKPPTKNDKKSIVKTKRRLWTNMLYDPFNKIAAAIHNTRNNKDKIKYRTPEFISSFFVMDFTYVLGPKGRYKALTHLASGFLRAKKYETQAIAYKPKTQKMKGSLFTIARFTA